MVEIHYEITFLSDWHVGSGLSGGPEADAIVLKDKDNLPYIPGKTIKGLLRDALEDLNEAIGSIDIKEIFGERDSGIRSLIHFSDAEIVEEEKNEITHNHLSEFLYRNIASTAIDKNGVAEKHSLRVMEVCLPLTLKGNISNIENQIMKDWLLKSLKWVRHAGVNRNRGLGRCKFNEIKNLSEK